jgi:hypothetical protein
MTDHQLASGMRQLRGQICTMQHQREVADEATRRGLMQFHEWPSGHWAYTDKGRNFLDGVEQS